jgi:branched-chain amino acid transport system permease protein
VAAIPARIPTTYTQLTALRPSFGSQARLVLLALVACGFPFVAPRLYVSVALAVLLAIPGALALNMLTGVAGVVSIGNAAFMAVGAGVAAQMAARMHMPFLITVATAGVAGALFGTLVGAPSLRVRGIYLLVATLAFHYVAVFALQQFQARTVGEGGFTMPMPNIFGFDIDNRVAWYFVLLLLAVLATIVYANVMRSAVGRSWLLTRERELAAAVIGIDVSRAKILVFVASSCVIGLQGAVYAYYVNVVTYDQFSLNVAIAYVAMILIGGLGSAAGAIYGAVFVGALPYVLQEIALNVAPNNLWLQENLANIQNLVYGASIVGFLLFEPKGLVGITGRVRRYFEMWPFGRERQSEARDW